MQLNRTLAIGLVVVAAASLSGGCSSTRSTKLPADDSQIRHAIEAELGTDPDLPVTQVGIISHEGVVVLTGRVQTVAQKQKAETIARRAQGVKRVANTIKVGEAAVVGPDGS